jgi:hypothetical protein
MLTSKCASSGSGARCCLSKASSSWTPSLVSARSREGRQLGAHACRWAVTRCSSWGAIKLFAAIYRALFVGGSAEVISKIGSFFPFAAPTFAEGGGVMQRLTGQVTDRLYYQHLVGDGFAQTQGKQHQRRE